MHALLNPPILPVPSLQLFAIFAVVMNSYHWWLILSNLSTNEHMNKARYMYLRDDLGRFKNTFDQGAVSNVVDFLTRGRKLVTNPFLYSQLYKQLNKERRLSANADDGDSQRDGADAADAAEMVSSYEGGKALLSASHGEQHV
jgi:hypothetical protein